MRRARALIVLAAMLTTAGCARQSQPAYVMIDPTTGQQLGVVSQPVPVQQTAYAQQTSPYQTSPQYSAPQTSPSQQQAQAERGRGLFSRPPAPQPYYGGQPAYGAPYSTAPGNVYAAVPPATSEPYTLDAGDKLRVIVFGQDGISNTYIVDAGGNVTLPLIGSVPARGTTTQQLALAITERLKRGFVREPHVSVEVEQARPFFILGEVTTPGQYPYVPNMTAETAVAIAGGFAPRANKSTVQVTRNLPGQQMRGDVPLNFPLRPGDTIVVKERWF